MKRRPIDKPDWVYWLLLIGGFSLLLIGILPWPRTTNSNAPASQASGDYKIVYRNIQDVRQGDLVLSRNERTGATEAKAVEHAFSRVTDHLRILTIRSSKGVVQELRTTDEHPFWVAQTGWVNAGDLKVGQQLEQSDGSSATVTKTTYEPHPEGHRAYNLTVGDYHTYFARANGARAPPVLTHNMAVCPDDVYSEIGLPGGRKIDLNRYPTRGDGIYDGIGFPDGKFSAKSLDRAYPHSVFKMVLLENYVTTAS